MKSWTYSINNEEIIRYQVKLTKSEEGVAVSCPELSGCWSQGATEEEDLENTQDAIVDYLSVVDEPTQESETRYVEVARDAKTFGSILQKSD